LGLAAALAAGEGCSRRHARNAEAARTPEQKSAAAEVGAGALGARGGGPGLGRGLGRGGRRWEVGQTVLLSEAERGAVEIQTAKAVIRPMRSRLQAMGKLFVPQLRKAIVSYPFPARIAEIHALVGEWVTPGQKLVTLQSEEVGSARAEYYKAQADHELARQNLERERALFERGAGAQKNVFTAEAQFKVAAATLDAAEKKLHLLGFSEAQVAELRDRHEILPVITLFSPISGKIVESKAVLGAMVDQNVEIMTLMDPSLLWVEAEVYERDIARVKIGQEAEVTVPAYPGEVFKGRISFIGDILREETRTITVRTDVRNSDSKLKPGMFADVTLDVAEDRRALVVPRQAVLDDGDDRIVFVPSGGGYAPRLVKVGPEDNGWIPILEGLREGEEVVVAGSYQLKSKLYQDILKAAGVH
jgi:cobalt-zinc-cadmium efflux system membrane fusion protein